jgi:hypothetical protein
VNFGGSLNMFGGFTPDWEYRFSQIVKAKDVISLDIDMPDYASMLEARKDFQLPALAADIRAWQARSRTLRSTDLGLKWLAIGDSHTAAWAPWDSMVVKENGRTLNGQLKSDFQYVRDSLEKCSQLDGVTLVFGNIDVRHHICRLDADWREMWRAYKAFGDSLPIKVEYALPWPVEYEDRKLPKTGWYKGAPFWGAQHDRAQLINDIVSFCDDIGMDCVKYPAEWRIMDPIEYAKQCMEKPQSVHLSPAKYRRQNWGLSPNS